MKIDGISPNNRARALLYYFGLEGMHLDGKAVAELARLTSCSAADLLHATELPHSGLTCDHAGGFSAVRTCDMEWRRDTLAPRYSANLEYWQGVIAGFWATGALN
ncbi:hypothetical protein [Mesorhizobium sp. M1B.F.Ca.ET.045.04.1.1]|uniref:hypothetical protein n=1 Tax=Mesorhizobium sp. M1B.F.Ca.ET.045.04.1.1 TaxID=2493673 RepID=UPI000F753999|nr:hypothetical protein [Mesorhizobium sp. M1B.F.Ca.ET.045.04.1.1]AZO29367.1 hypothetical protein EJ071_19570 [Mesorhizobium sp. M1B.F.Ca.ET.045.04.1.1]